MQTESNWKDDEEFIEGYAASNVESEARKLVSYQLQQSLHTIRKIYIEMRNHLKGAKETGLDKQKAWRFASPRLSHAQFYMRRM